MAFGTEKNKAILINYLNALFDGMEVVEDLEYRQNEHLEAGSGDRYVIFDVYDGERGCAQTTAYCPY